MKLHKIITRESRAQRKTVHAAEVAAMLPDKLRELMIATIIEAVRDRGTVTTDDLLRAAIPADFIKSNFKPCLALAKDREPQLFRD